MNNSLNNRMQRNYEVPARHLLTRRVPVIVRVDGRAFHTFTKNFRKPFDQRLIDSMIIAATTVAGEMQGFKLAYIQSDEASFVMTDYDNLQTDAWFGYVKSKVESITASIMTAAFARCMRLAKVTTLAYFDARAFNVPPGDVANYFLGRAKDWYRNSVSMYARAHFSHVQLKKKRISDMHEMLYSIGRNWSTDLTDEEKNGIFLVGPSCQSRSDIEPHYSEIGPLWESVEPCETLIKDGQMSHRCLTKSPNISNKPAKSESNSESSATVGGSNDGALGNGT